jgi:hypothetical protein
MKEWTFLIRRIKTNLEYFAILIFQQVLFIQITVFQVVKNPEFYQYFIILDRGFIGGCLRVALGLP